MITTVTINPCIDRNVYMDSFLVGGLNRVKHAIISPAGKGINVSRAVLAWGINTHAICVLGGDSGRFIHDSLRMSGIPVDPIWIEEDTRTNIKLVDLASNTCTEVNENGPTIPSKVLETLRSKISAHAQVSSIMVLSGSVPKSVPHTMYKDIIYMLRDTNCKTVLDTSGQLLKEGIKAKPWMIKPNLVEMEQLMGKSLTTQAQCIDACKEVLAEGVTYIAMTLGDNGLIFASNDAVYYASAPRIAPKSTAGAGDTFLGTLLSGFEQKMELDENIARAAAAGTASVTLEGTLMPGKHLIEHYRQQVEMDLL